MTGIEKNHKQQQEAKKGDEVAVKIESSPENAKEYGKHFDHQPDVCSKISTQFDLLIYFICHLLCLIPLIYRESQLICSFPCGVRSYRNPTGNLF